MPAAIPQDPHLAGRYIRLDPITERDLPELYRAIGHPEVFAGGWGGGPAGYRDTEAGFVEFGKGYFAFERDLVFGIRLVGGEHDGRLVGTSTLGDFELDKERAHIGWTAYDPRVWSTAVNPEAKLLMLGLAFDSGFGRVKIQADSVNARSRAAIAKLGATFEGIVRRDQRRADGSWRDAAVYSVIIDDWPVVRAGLEARLDGYGGEPVSLRETDAAASA